MEHCNVNLTGIDAYNQENQELADWFLQEYFYKYFSVDTPRPDKMGRNIELIISPKCNLGCKYCYVHRHRDKIFDDGCWDEERTIVNLKKILQWLSVNNYNPNIEIFSGELLAQEVGYKVLETLYDHFKDQDPIMRPESIVIPTNFTFVCSPEANARVDELYNKFDSINIRLGLSASFDGKYMEENRPYLHDLDVDLGGGVRDDDYYDRAFSYANKIYGGLHPMIYSKNIDAWPQNFLWFQEMMEKHDIPWEHLYLLHVRNEEWNIDQIKSFQKFIEFIFDWVWNEKLEHNPEYLANWILRANGFNLLSQSITTCGRGLTCGIQSQFTVRVSDLMMYPCHRLGYRDLYYGQLVEDEEKVLKFKAINAELLIATYAVEKNSLPHCAQCPINGLCGGTCLGSQYESTQNMFTPIPSVCIISHMIAATTMQCLKKYGAWNIVYDKLSDLQREQFRYLEEELENVE